MTNQTNLDTQIIALDILHRRAGMHSINLDLLKNKISKNKKSANFKRLANLRVNNAIKSIRLVHYLSDNKSYNYNLSEIKEIEKLITNALEDLKISFKSKHKHKKKEKN